MKTNETGKSRPHSELENDPRALPDFDATCFPAIDGKPVPESENLVGKETEKLRFAAVYYYLNRTYLDLLHARRQARDETSTLRKIEQILIVRDQLDDEFTPLGFLAEPVVRDGITVDLKFLSPPPPRPAAWASVFVSVPLPPGVAVEKPH